MFTSILLLILAMISIQTGASFAKNLFPLAGAAGTTSLRLIFATMILLIIWRPWRMKFSSLKLKHLALYGGALGLMNLSFYFALERIPLGLAVTLEFLGPLMLSLLASRKKIDFLWVTLAALGIFMVMPKSDLTHQTDFLGVIFAVIAGLFWALYIYFGKKAGDELSGGIAATMGMAFATLITLPFGLMIDGDRFLSLELVPMALFVAILSSALPYSLEMISLKKMPTKTFGILMSLEPAVASLVGFLFLKESLNLTQWLAIVCVMAASLGSSFTSRTSSLESSHQG